MRASQCHTRSRAGGLLEEGNLSSTIVVKIRVTVGGIKDPKIAVKKFNQS